MTIVIKHTNNSDTSNNDKFSGTNLVRAGDHNQRVTLQAIRANGPITRAELSRLTGLTAPAIANITNRLLSDGLVKKNGRIFGGRGQPATKFIANPNGAFSFGLNIDRDHITFIVMDFVGQTIYRDSIETNFAMPDEVLKFTIDNAEKFYALNSNNKKKTIGIAIAIPDDIGFIEFPNRPEKYSEWSNVKIEELISDALNLSCYIENDATVSAIGELQFGDGLIYKSFVYSLISAGLGCGFVINSESYKGAFNKSGEIGYLPVTEGSKETLQDTISIYSLYNYLRENKIEINEPTELENPEYEVYVNKWIQKVADIFFTPSLTINIALNPEIHFIGSRIPSSIMERLCDILNKKLDDLKLVSKVPAITRFKRASSSGDAPALGAAVLVIQNKLLPHTNVFKNTHEMSA